MLRRRDSYPLLCSFFHWHDIMQVIISRASAGAVAGSHRDEEGLMTCPICLSPPIAPRMTRCGHVSAFEVYPIEPSTSEPTGILFPMHFALPEYIRCREMDSLPYLL